MAYKARIKYFDKEHKDFITLADAAEIDDKVSKDALPGGSAVSDVIMQARSDGKGAHLIVVPYNADGTPAANVAYDILATGPFLESAYNAQTKTLAFSTTATKGGLITAATFALLPAAGESDFTYYVIDEKKLYYWDGSAYHVMSSVEQLVHDATLTGDGTAASPLSVNITVDGRPIEGNDIYLGINNIYNVFPGSGGLLYTASGADSLLRLMSDTRYHIIHLGVPQANPYTYSGADGQAVFSNPDGSRTATLTVSATGVVWVEGVTVTRFADATTWLTGVSVDGTFRLVSKTAPIEQSFWNCDFNNAYTDGTFSAPNYFPHLLCTVQAYRTINDVEEDIKDIEQTVTQDNAVLDAHLADNVRHITQAERDAWNTAGADVAQETADRIAAEAALDAKITTEADARAAADTALGQRIDNEAASRAQGDSALQSAITSEGTTRSNADTALGTRIDAEAAARGNADTQLQSAITSEGTARANADTALGTRIDNEITDRTNADSALGARIDAVENLGHYVGSVATYADLATMTLPPNTTVNDFATVRADETHANAITRYVISSMGPPVVWTFDFEIQVDMSGKMDKITDATQAGKLASVLANGNIGAPFVSITDIASSDALANETSARLAAEALLQTNITNEAAARASADTNLGTRIDNEASARASADTNLGTRIDNEITDRTTGDTNLNAALTAHTGNAAVHVTAANKAAWDAKLDTVSHDSTITGDGKGTPLSVVPGTVSISVDSNVFNGNGTAGSPLTIQAGKVEIAHGTSLTGTGKTASPLEISVKHDATLSGDGTAANPLIVQGGEQMGRYLGQVAKESDLAGVPLPPNAKIGDYMIVKGGGGGLPDPASVTWTNITLGSGGGLSLPFVAYGAGRFVLTSVEEAWYSDDAVTWTKASTKPNITLSWSSQYGVQYIHDRFIVGTNARHVSSLQIGYSKNGEAWSVSTLPESVEGEVSYVRRPDGVWYLFSTSGKCVYISTDDMGTWNKYALSLPSGYTPVFRENVYFTGNRFYALLRSNNERYLYSSADGVSWATRVSSEPLNNTPLFTYLVYFRDKFIIYVNTVAHQYKVSIDKGVTWEAKTDNSYPGIGPHNVDAGSYLLSFDSTSKGVSVGTDVEVMKEYSVQTDRKFAYGKGKMVRAPIHNNRTLSYTDAFK
jgi:hypothetical protein